MKTRMDCPQFRIYRPLMPMATVLIAGIAAGVWLPGYFWWFLAIALMGCYALWRHILEHRWCMALPLIACMLCGYLSIQSWLVPDLPDHHISRFADKGYWRIHGVVAYSPKIQRGRWQVVLEAKSIENKHNTHDTCGKLRVTGRGEWPGAKIGDGVVFRGRLRSIRNFSNPGGFDYRRSMMLKGVRARVYASANSFKIESVSSAVSLTRRTEHLRRTLSLRMDNTLKDDSPDVVRLLKALILGDRSGISPALRDDFNRAGAGHVLAISGLHVGMVATVSFFAARWILALIPIFLRLAWVRKGAALVSLVPVLGYGILAGLSPSTQRAMLMVTVFLLGMWVGRRHDWLNTLALAALLILMIYPPALLSISFQLSFSAVLAIIAGSRCIPKLETATQQVLWKKLGHRLMAFMGVSAFAILGTMPLVLHYFNQISLVGLVTNLIVVPLVGFVVVPAGLLGTLTTMVNETMGALFWHVAAWGGQWMLWIVQHASSWSWSAVKCVTPSGLEICLYYALGALGLFWKRMPYRSEALAVILSICVLDAGYWTYQRNGSSGLKVTAIDVGQASANLLELPDGYTILVDGGGFSDNSIFDVGATIIAPLLWHKKISTIDLIVLSHPNSDHLNGLLYILEHFKVHEVWSNQEPADTKGYARWSELLADRNTSHRDFQLMQRQVTRNGVVLSILAPPADFMTREQEASWRDSNNNSIVLRVCYGDVSFLFSGDIEESAEMDLVSRMGANDLASTILFVPHHGSRGSSSMAFVNAVNPKEAIISAGWQNRFKFPHGQVLERFETQGSRIWSTAEAGAVEVSTNGKTYKIKTYGPKTPYP